MDNRVIRYPDGKKKSDGTWEITPVYSILGWKLRLDWWQAHHGYWGFMGMALSAYGAIEAFKLYSFGVDHQYPTQEYIGLALIVVQVLAFLVWTYVMLDDFYDQHPKQIYNFDPLYHSPVHYWYGRTLYKNSFIRWLNNAVSSIIHRFK